MSQIKIWANGEDLTVGVEYVVENTAIPEIVAQGFAVEIIRKVG